MPESDGKKNFCLFGLSQSDLRIWVCDLDSSSHTWSLLNSVSIQDLFGHTSVDEITLHGVEELGELVYLQADGIIYELRISTMKVTKIYEMLPEDGDFERIYPCMMIWPPIFPLRHELDENAEKLVTANVAGNIKGKIGGGYSTVIDKQKIRIRLFRDDRGDTNDPENK